METPTTAGLWQAIYTHAEVWSQTPAVQQVADQLPRNSRPEDCRTGAPTIPALLQQLNAGFGAIMHPLMLGTRIPLVMGQQYLHVQSAVDQDDLARWLRAAAELESAHRVTLAWFRSRLPAYPLIRAPQLARNSPFTTLEYTPRFIWTDGERSAGLQFTSAPPRAAQLLGASRRSVRQLEQAAREVHRELALTAPWLAFTEAHNNLNPDAKAALSGAKRHLVERLRADAIDRHEPAKGFERSQYRAHETAEVVAALTGPAGAYANAFTAVEDLLQLAVTDVFGELVLHGDPISIDVFNVAFGADNEPLVEFQTAGALSLFLDAGQIVWLEDPIVHDAVRIETLSFHFSQTDEATHVGARLLKHSSAVWPREQPKNRRKG